MPRLDRLPELQRKTLLTYPVLHHEDSPFTRPTKTLAESRVALVTTAGIHLRGDIPFSPGDQTYRVFPSQTSAADLIQTHISIGFDRSGIARDLNVVFPIERLREMSDHGEIGSLGPTSYAFLGAQRPPYDALIERSGPEVARRLRDEGVDVVLLTGT